jgi:hypothetical protein
MLTPQMKSPLIDGTPLSFTHAEGLGFWRNGRFEVALLHQLMVQKILALIPPKRCVNALGQFAPLETYSVKKVPRRFWGRRLFGYYIVRMQFGRGQSRRTYAVQFVRASEENFNGFLFNHPHRRNGAK